MKPEPAVEAYRKIAAVYETAPNPATALERRVLARLLPSVDGERVIDVGAGNGYWASHCRARGAQAVAIDGCQEMLARGTGFRVVGDARRLPVRDGSAGVVICSMMLGYAPNAFSELARITRVGGSVFVTDIHPEALARGWVRSFRVGADVVRPECQHYEIAAMSDASLIRRGLWEVAFGERERAIFELAGKAASFASMSAYPAIFVARWSKVC